MDFEKELSELAKRHCLTLSESDAKRFARELAEVREWFYKLDEVEVDKLETVSGEGRLREDKVKEWEWDPFCNAGDEMTEKNFFKGPRVVKGSEKE
jgi:aspartyl/glutamyl-tRNA(Asn/Gln) amidotransferase C subunit